MHSLHGRRKNIKTNVSVGMFVAGGDASHVNCVYAVISMIQGTYIVVGKKFCRCATCKVAFIGC